MTCEVSSVVVVVAFAVQDVAVVYDSSVGLRFLANAVPGVPSHGSDDDCTGLDISVPVQAVDGHRVQSLERSRMTF